MDSEWNGSNVVPLRPIRPKLRFCDENGQPVDRFGLLALLLSTVDVNAPTAEELKELYELIQEQRADMLGVVDQLEDPDSQEVLFAPKALRREQHRIQRRCGADFRPSGGIWLY